MKTLIEIFDPRPIENVLAAEVFRPETVIYLCPSQIAQNKGFQNCINRFMNHRGLNCRCEFFETSLLYTSKVEKRLRSIFNEYEDCALEITGGSDAVLFAAGMVCAENSVPVFTYSNRRGRFFSIHNAEFVEPIQCNIDYKVEDFFLMAGGAMQPGRVDNSILSEYLPVFDAFFSVFLKHRRSWSRIIDYIQKASQPFPGLEVTADYTLKCGRGKSISAPEDALRDLERAGMIIDLNIFPKKKISFSFSDSQFRKWLRDVGSVLELYIYKQCIDTGIFNDVVTSAVVDWGRGQFNAVTNEIDVIAVNGVKPCFISCKVCEIDTDALNELYILAERFGGDSVRPFIVTAQKCRDITRHRASQLGIGIIDIDDLINGRFKNYITA